MHCRCLERRWKRPQCHHQEYHRGLHSKSTALGSASCWLGDAVVGSAPTWLSWCLGKARFWVGPAHLSSQLHRGQGGADQGIRPAGDCRALSHAETEKSRDTGVNNTGMRGRELRVVLPSPLQQKPMQTAALNSYQSTTSSEQ